MAPDPELDRLLTKMSEEGHTRAHMMEYLVLEKNYTICLRTISRHLKRLGLSTMQPHLTKEEKDKCLLLMKLYHTRRWQQNEVVRVIQNRHQMPLFSMTMLKTLSKRSGLHWRKDDIELGIITPEEAAEKILKRKQGGEENAGFGRMAHVMATAESVRLNRNSVGELLAIVDTEELHEVIVQMDLDLDNLEAGGDPQELYPLVPLDEEDEEDIDEEDILLDNFFYFEGEDIDVEEGENQVSDQEFE
ncbi:uncharacterized protein MELLADRAFT_106416 [Melampsora larici-populina 98AG31]|uniref:Uncharacterized protein n=1 Tax=Melampsora larici-populina (strain 98AG31 / pathotype 3-4-7) TaxID=747676 RepID=F4RLB2_MELLP|nr:uncharacterized protein MELLADRAFT_106416 [Melampsora larici-populina 98AG31]EGG06902.1 hypothetical protein MELLADRAFT_106416 [Melampsora larici-populina 98AG31]